MDTTINSRINTAKSLSALLKKDKSLAQTIHKLIPKEKNVLKNDVKLQDFLKRIANITTTQSAAASNNVATKSDANTKTIEGVKVEGYDSLSAKEQANLSKELKTYKEKITKSIKNGNFDKFIEKAFGRKVDNPQELAALKKAALNGEWDKVIPKIKIGSQSDFATAKNANGQSVNAMGAFIKGSGEGGATGTIILNKELLNGPVKVNGKAMTFQNILTEEVGHAWDTRLNKTDSKGDEGEALSLMFASVDKTGIALQQTMNDVEAALKQNDHGTMTVTDKDGNQKTIEVEFGWLSKAWKKIKKGVKKIGKSIVKGVKKIGGAIVDGVKSVGKAIVKGVKELAQSKIFAVVLQIAQFIPALAPFAAIARGAMAAYNVVKGIKDGNLMQAISGIAGGALGGIGKALGASASTMANVASYAGKAAGIARTFNAVKNGDITGALMSGAAAANGAGLIDQNTMSNIQNFAQITNVVQTGDITRGVQLGLQYANGSDWAQENQAGINKINSAFNLYGSITSGTDADRINAAASFGQQMGVLNEQTTGNIHYATNFVSAVKSGNVNQVSNALAERNFINQTTANQIQSANTFASAVRTGNVNQIANTLLDNNFIDASTASGIKSANNVVSAVKNRDVNQLTNTLLQNNLIDMQTVTQITSANNLVTAVKAGDVSQLTGILSENNFIDKNTADNVVRLSDYYSNAKEHKNNIEQMIATKNYNVQASNDAVNFLMTGTNSIPVTNQTNQSITGFIPSWSTPGINSGFANSFAGDDVAYKQVNSNNLDNPKIDKGYYESSVKVNPKSKATGLELALTYHKGEALPKPSDSSKQGIVTTVVDVGTDLLPIVSNIKDADIAINGVNRVTGEKVGVGGRILSGFFALPVVGNIGKYIAKGGALIYKGVKSATKGAEITSGVAKSTKQVDSVATTGVKNTGKDVPYDSRTMREQLEVKYGKENVTSTTVPPANASNVKLGGKHKDIILPDGTKARVVFDKKGFPIFDDVAKYDTRLPNEAFHSASYKGQMKMASTDLSSQIKNGKIPSSQFSDAQLKAIHSGKDKVPGYTWHHHQDNGRMQLVPTKIHGKVGHIGGEAMSRGQ